MDRKKKITIGIIALVVMLFMASAVIYGITKSDNKDKDKAAIELSEKEEEKAKDLESEMDKKLKEAKTDEEKEAIKKEYAEKIEKATDGKVTVSGNGKVETTKPSSKPIGGSSSSSSGSSTSKPSSGSSSGSTSSNTSKPSKPTEPSKPSKPSHTHSWQPVYETVTKYRTEYEDKYYYNGKYYDDYDVAMEQQYNDVINNISGGSVSPVTVEVQVPYQESVLKGYKCSCGATQ